MLERIKAARPSPAMGVAFLALLLALGGTASALKGKNSVDNGDLKKNAVTSNKIKNENVTGDDVSESSLGEVPLAANGVHGYARINGSGTVLSTPTALNRARVNSLSWAIDSAIAPVRSVSAARMRRCLQP